MAKAQEDKQIKSEAKAKAKLDKRLEKSSKPKQGPTLDGKEANVKEKKVKFSKETKKKIKIKKEKEPFDYKLAFKEFPVKMVKEVGKIKWSGSSNLTRKYITVIIFMTVFAITFFLVDLGINYLFIAMKVF